MHPVRRGGGIPTPLPQVIQNFVQNNHAKIFKDGETEDVSIRFYKLENGLEFFVHREGMEWTTYLPLAGNKGAFQPHRMAEAQACLDGLIRNAEKEENK